MWGPQQPQQDDAVRKKWRVKSPFLPETGISIGHSERAFNALFNRVYRFPQRVTSYERLPLLVLNTCFTSFHTKNLPLASVYSTRVLS